jgi:hypothetical protein
MDDRSRGVPLRWGPGAVNALADRARGAPSGTTGLLIGKRRMVSTVQEVDMYDPARVARWHELVSDASGEVVAWYVVRARSRGRADDTVVTQHRRLFAGQPVVALVIDPLSGASEAYEYERGKLVFLGSGNLWTQHVAPRRVRPAVLAATAVAVTGVLVGAGAHLLAG